MMAFVQAARRSLAERPSRISWVKRLAAVRANCSVSASVMPAPSRFEGLTWRSSARALICAAAPWTRTTRMLSERNTATSSRMLAKFSSVTIPPSTLMTKIFSRNCGMYCRMPRRSVSFTVDCLVSECGISSQFVVRFKSNISGTEDGGQRVQAPFVCRRITDRDANPLSQLISTHGANNDALPLQLLKHPLTVADTDEDEVGSGANGLASHFSKCVGK